MKKTIIILLFPILASAQIQLNREQIKFNYEKIQLGREYKYRYLECRDLFNEQQLRVEALADSALVRDERNKELQSINRGLIDESQKLAVDNEKLRQQKPLSIGPYIGYDPFSKKASAGISIQYIIFRFRLW